MWKETKKELIAKENQLVETRFYTDEGILNVTPSCGCSEATVSNGEVLTLRIKTGKVAYGNQKLKKVHADVETKSGTTTVYVSINVFKDDHYPITS